MRLTIRKETSDSGAGKPASGQQEVNTHPAVVCAASASDGGMQLFRSEALTDCQAHWLGTVLLTPRRSDHLFTMAAILAVVAILALLVLGGFTRKARVNGWLVPQQGLVRVFAPQPGVVTGLYAKEGAQVRKGDRLIKLSSELESATLGATQAQVAQRLTELSDSLRKQRIEDERLLAQQQHTYTERLAALRQEIVQIGHDISIMKDRVELAEGSASVNRTLRAQGYISRPQLEGVEADRLEQHERLGTLQRQQIELKREEVTLAGELEDLPVKAQAEIAEFDRKLAATEQELAQAEARREIVVTAPADGIVTAILAEQGGHANVSGPLLSIVPVGATLEAHLYGPSRAVGFVHAGQQVLLRYQAYPYQKFGHYDGLVASVSRSAVSPEELTGQLAGVAGAEPVYRITVRLMKQTVHAYGREINLQPGMQLDADIALERRRLYEWVLDPLYTVTGR